MRAVCYGIFRLYKWVPCAYILLSARYLNKSSYTATKLETHGDLGPRVVFVGGSRGTSPSLDLTFPLTGLSENLGGMERGGEGKEKGKGGGDHLPYFPHWLLPQIPPCLALQ